MAVLRYVLFFYALFTVFISGGIFFQKSGKTYDFLAFFFLLFGLEILEFLYSTSSYVLINPRFNGIYYFGVCMLYGPLLWFHFRFFLNESYRFKWYDALHLLPFLIVIAYIWNIMGLNGAERIEYIRQYFLTRIMPLNYAKAIHTLSYGVAVIVLIRLNYLGLGAKKRLYAISICTIYFVTAILLSWLTGYAEGWRDFAIYYLLTATIVFITGFVLYRDPKFLREISKKYLNSGLSEVDMKRIHGKILRSLSVDQVYLQKDLTLARLADLVEEKSHNISQTLSEFVQESFNDLVNRHRVEHAKGMLKDSKFDYYKIEAIGIDSGFNNRVTFHKAFVKITSMTPSIYRSSG